YVGTREGGILVYDKSNWNLTRKFGDFTWYARYEANKPTPYSKKRVNPMLPIFIAFAFFFVIAVIIEAYAHIRKKPGKLTWSVVRKFFASFVKVEDVLKILGITSIIILIVGIINPRLAFPYYVSNLKIIYYFDALVKRGSFLPIWFLLLPTLAYWMTKKSKKGVRYLASALALAIAVVVYLLAPKLV
nr:hypothetical protein [Nanoarchaeota archaeon]